MANRWHFSGGSDPFYSVCDFPNEQAALRPVAQQRFSARRATAHALGQAARRAQCFEFHGVLDFSGLLKGLRVSLFKMWSAVSFQLVPSPLVREYRSRACEGAETRPLADARASEASPRPQATRKGVHSQRHCLIPPTLR